MKYAIFYRYGLFFVKIYNVDVLLGVTMPKMNNSPVRCYSIEQTYNQIISMSRVMMLGQRMLNFTLK